MRYGNNPSKRPRHTCSRSPSRSFQHGAVALWEVFLLQTIFSHIVHSITFSFEMPNVWFAGRFAVFLSQKGNRTRKITFKGEVLAFSCSPSFSLMIPKYTVHLKQTPMYSLSDAANRTASAVLWTFCAPTQVVYFYRNAGLEKPKFHLYLLPAKAFYNWFPWL